MYNLKISSVLKLLLVNINLGDLGHGCWFTIFFSSLNPSKLHTGNNSNNNIRIIFSTSSSDFFINFSVKFLRIDLSASKSILNSDFFHICGHCLRANSTLNVSFMGK